MSRGIRRRDLPSDIGDMDSVGYHTRQAQQAAVGLESLLGGGE